MVRLQSKRAAIQRHFDGAVCELDSYRCGKSPEGLAPSREGSGRCEGLRKLLLGLVRRPWLAENALNAHILEAFVEYR